MAGTLRIAQVAPPLRARPAASLWRHRTDHRRARARAPPSRPRGHDLRQRRLGRPGRARRDGPRSPARDRLCRRGAAVHADTIQEVLARAARVRPHPQPSRVGERAARQRSGRSRSSRPSTAGSTCRGPTRSSRDPPGGLVAISQNQASTHPDVPWAAIVHNGLTLTGAPFKHAAGTARVRRPDHPGKGRSSRRSRSPEPPDRPLRIAAKAGPTEKERAYYDEASCRRSNGRRSLVEYPRRARGGGPRPAVRRELRHADARLVAGAVRPGRDRVAGVRDAGHRPPHRRAAGDHPRGRRRLLRRRRRRGMAFMVDGSASSTARRSGRRSSTASPPPA